MSFQLNPEEYGFQIDTNTKTSIDLAHYGLVSEVYREPLSATSLSIAIKKDQNEVEIFSFEKKIRFEESCY